MSMSIVPGFKKLTTLHCVTGSMRHVYAWAGHDISEELLLGLGEGVGFTYFHFKGQAPFLGGRVLPKPGMEEIAGLRTGVSVERKTPSSDAAAERSLLAELDAGRPVMMMVDMGFLPYFDFGGTDYHFGGHAIVACGHDAGTGDFLVADREGESRSLPAAALRAARSSRYKPFPPGRAWLRFSFDGFRPPERDELLLAIRKQCASMLSPPIANLGVKGIAKAARECLRWPSVIEPGALAGTLFNIHIFVSATGGSGGGCFRYMFGRFLSEAAAYGLPVGKMAASFKAIGDAWEEGANLCREASKGAGMDEGAAAAALPGLSLILGRVAGLEDKAWSELARIAG